MTRTGGLFDAPRLSAACHLAVYTTFHRARGNKLVHGACVPVIFATALVLMAHAAVGARQPALDAVAHLGTPVALALFAVLARIDRVGAACVLAFCLAAGAVARRLVVLAHGSPALVLGALALHALAWYASVVVGHVELEPRVATGLSRAEDSNLYFRRGYFLARDLGRETSRADALVQFCIAPLSVVQDAFALLGLRAELEHAVAHERERVLMRLSRGEAPLGATAAEPVGASDALAAPGSSP